MSNLEQTALTVVKKLALAAYWTVASIGFLIWALFWLGLAIVFVWAEIIPYWSMAIILILGGIWTGLAWPEITRAMTVAPRQHKREEIMKKVQEMLKFMNREDRQVGTCPVSRLYGHVRECSPEERQKSLLYSRLRRYMVGEWMGRFYPPQIGRYSVGGHHASGFFKPVDSRES